MRLHCCTPWGFADDWRAQTSPWMQQLQPSTPAGAGMACTVTGEACRAHAWKGAWFATAKQHKHDMLHTHACRLRRGRASLPAARCRPAIGLEPPLPSGAPLPHRPSWCCTHPRHHMSGGSSITVLPAGLIARNIAISTWQTHSGGVHAAPSLPFSGGLSADPGWRSQAAL